MKTHVKFIALFAAILFAANTSTYAANNSGNNHPAAAGMGGQANGCTHGQATGNKHCTDTTTEVHNEHVQTPPANQIGGNGGSSTPPVEPKLPPPVEPKVPVPTEPKVPVPPSEPQPPIPNNEPKPPVPPSEPRAPIPPGEPKVPTTPGEPQPPQPNPTQSPTIPDLKGVPTGPRGRAEVSRPMPDNPNLTIQRATGDRRQRGGESGTSVVPPNPPSTLTVEPKVPVPPDEPKPPTPPSQTKAPPPSGQVPTQSPVVAPPDSKATPTPSGSRGRMDLKKTMPDESAPAIARATGERRQREAGSLTPPGTSPDRVGNKTPEGHKLVTRYPGRQPLHDLPRFASENRNQETYCALSGYHRRKFADVFGQETEAGSLPSLRNGGSIVRDIPAWHEPSPNCLIVIKRRTQE